MFANIFRANELKELQLQLSFDHISCDAISLRSSGGRSNKTFSGWFGQTTIKSKHSGKA